MTGQLILGLSILVGLHELGHLLTAKMFGMRVEQYSIGFPPKIVGFHWKGTEYLLGAIPLGGYVKISGMIDESMDKDFLEKEPEPWEFRSKPAWQRLIVMMGGIIVNVITGIIIFIIIAYSKGERYLPAEEAKYGIVALPLAEEIGLKTGDQIININGESYERFSDVYNPEILLESDSYYTILRDGKEMKIDIPNDFIDVFAERKEEGFIDPYPIATFKVGNVVPNSPASKSGMKTDDRIVAVNGKEIQYFHQLKQVLNKSKGKEISYTVKRKEGEKKLKATVSEEGTLGFEPLLDFDFVTKKFGVFESMAKGTEDAFGVVVTNAKGLKKIVTGEASASKSLSGPIGIAQVFGGTWHWGRFWYITGLLSMVLAFMNFLPIPALDGGHVMFLTYEIVSGRKPSDKFLEVSQKVGMILLLGIMVFAIFNDIFKAIF